MNFKIKQWQQSSGVVFLVGGDCVITHIIVFRSVLLFYFVRMTVHAFYPIFPVVSTLDPLFFVTFSAV